MSEFGVISTSLDLGRTWTAVLNLGGILIIAPATRASLTTMVLPYNPGYGFAIYRDGYWLLRDDGTGIDYSYDSTTQTVTFALAVNPAEQIIVVLGLGLLSGGSVTPSIAETPAGVMNSGPQSATVATGSSTTSFTSATEFLNGTIFLFTGGTSANVGKTCLVTAVTGSGPYTYTVSNGDNTTGLSAAPAATDTFHVAFTLANTPITNVLLGLNGASGPPLQGSDFLAVGNAVQYVTISPGPGDVHQATYCH